MKGNHQWAPVSPAGLNDLGEISHSCNMGRLVHFFGYLSVVDFPFLLLLLQFTRARC